MERDYDLYLKDMLDAIEAIQEYTAGMEFEEFAENDLVVDGVLQNFQVLGEAAGEIPAEVREEHDHIPWRDIQDFRNVVVHKYWTVDEEIAWDIVQERLPNLHDQLAALYGAGS